VRCFVVAGFLLTSASRGPSAIAEFLVIVAFIRIHSQPIKVINDICQPFYSKRDKQDLK